MKKTKLKPGDVCVVNAYEPGKRGALVLITKIEPGGKFIHATLLSPDLELGTSQDLIVQFRKAGYALLAESDIFGYVSPEQIRAKIGSVNSGVLALRNGDEVPEAQAIAGPPLLSRQDPRWNFKNSELLRLQEVGLPILDNSITP